MYARPEVRTHEAAGGVVQHHPTPAEVPGLTEYVGNTVELDALPNLSVVQFRGPDLGDHNRLVWQLDEEWFSPGSTVSVPSTNFPAEAFPAAVLWKPAPRSA
mgnify:CR=1 FL=1